MKHLRNIYLKIHIHCLTLIYFVFAWLGGYLKWYLSALLIVCVHELCHLMMAYYFHFDIEKIEILPFGAYLTLGDFYCHSIMEELCVVLAGPCSHLFIGIFLERMSQSVYQAYLIQINLYVFLFNLLPIYPLDGNRICGLLLQTVMDIKKSMYWQLKISVFCLSILSIFFFQINTIVIISYLFIQQFQFVHDIPIYLRQCYRMIPLFSQSKKMMVHKDLTYRRNYHNYYLIDSKIYDEKEMIFELIRHSKKDKKSEKNLYFS